MRRLCIDEDFKNLIPPLSETEFAQLEESCVKYGIKDAIKVWNRTIVDGHNRYAIAQKHKIGFRTTDMRFKSFDEARLWIVENQFGRRNLSTYDRCALALKLKPSFIKKAKANQMRTADNRVCQKSDKQRMNTNKELAKVAGVSHDTIHKVEVIEKHGDKTLIEQIRKGDVSINEAYRTIKGLSEKNPSLPTTPTPIIPVAKETKTPEHITASDFSAEEPENSSPVSNTALSEKVDNTPNNNTDSESLKTKEPLPFNNPVDEIDNDVISEHKDTFNVYDAMVVTEIKTGIAKLLDIKTMDDVDAIEEIRKSTDSETEKNELKQQIKNCIKFLVHLETGLADW